MATVRQRASGRWQVVVQVRQPDGTRPIRMTADRPRLLDLFCNAGGATKGYQRAGFHVVGVDIDPQPDYCGDEFHQADALEFELTGFDAIHASTPLRAISVRNGRIRVNSAGNGCACPNRAVHMSLCNRTTTNPPPPPNRPT